MLPLRSGSGDPRGRRYETALAMNQAVTAPVLTRNGKRQRAWSVDAGPLAGLGLLMPLLVMLGLLVAYPLVKLAIASFSGGGTHNYVAFFNSPADVNALLTTLKDSAIVTAISVGLGSLYAWKIRTARSRVAGGVLIAAVLVPFWMGVIVKNYIFTILLDRLGPLNFVLLHLHFPGAPFDLLYTQTAVIIGMTYTMLPYAVLPLFAAFRTIDLDLTAAAKTLGATPTRVAASIIAPLAAPGIAATTAIVFVISIGFYITPILLGGATSPFTSSLIEQEIFQYYDYTTAAVAGTVLLAFAVVILATVYALLGGRRFRAAVG